jgi:pyruvate/2-oxoglutarate dehydrogenase complex dihydrolipoamide acyltransferase (E2) component
MYELKMPQWGMNMTEGDISKWLKREGERVEKNEPIVEIETAKTVDTFNSPVSGVVAKLIVQEGDTVPIQDVIALIDVQGG